MLFPSSSSSIFSSLFIFGICCLLLFSGANHHRGVNGGNIRPYGVPTTGFQGAGSVGQDASANGYAGSSLVSPLASGGFNSPLARNTPSSSNGNPSGAGFGGFGHQQGGGRSSPVAGGQGDLPYGSGRG